MKKAHLYSFVILAIIGIALLTNRAWLRTKASQTVRVLNGKKTVDDRIGQFGAIVKQRLAPEFEAAGVAYPPTNLVLVGLKEEKLLEVWVSSPPKLLKTHPILGASGRMGPKLREGDLQVPEGLYEIESLNPNSRFHLSLRINYPNDFDRAKGCAENRTNLGGDIMIHGNTCSIGCLAMGDEAAEDLFILAAETGIENISVILAPFDFRKYKAMDPTHPLPDWTPALYEEIKRELNTLRIEPTPKPGNS